jgi:hypothetical protein
MVLIIVWCLFAVLGAAIGQGKGKLGEGLAAGLLLGPIGLIWIAVVKDERKHCPHCREVIAAEAAVCPHCQRDIPDPANFACPKCKKRFFVATAARGHSTRCPHCKKMVQT